MHALGICEGYAENGWIVTIIGGKSLSLFHDDIPSSVKIIELKEPKGILTYPIWWIRVLKSYIEQQRKEEFNTVIVRYVMSGFLLSMFIGLKSSSCSKTILEVNSFAYHAFANIPRWLNLLISRLEMIIVNRYKVLYVVSETMAKDPRNKECKAKIVCILNGATSKEIEYKPASEKIPSSNRLVYMGSLMPYWDFEYLINAINCLHSKSEN